MSELTIKNVVMEATRLRNTRLRNNIWAVRPKGQLGTCGSYPYLWTVIYVTARSPEEAIKRAIKRAKS